MGTSGSVISANSLGGIVSYSDIAILDTDNMDSTTLVALQSASPFSVFGSSSKSSPRFENGTSAIQVRQAGFSLPRNATNFSLLGGHISDGAYFYSGHFYSDGKTPTNILGLVELASLCNTGFSSNLAAFLTVIPQAYSTYGTTSFGVPVLPGALAFSLDGVPSSFSTTYYNGWISETMQFRYSSVFPAGFNKVNFYFKNTTNNDAVITNTAITFVAG
jgi:hypothetical protein